MQFFLPFFVALTVCTAGVVEDATAGYREGDRFFFFPGDGDGNHHLVDSRAPVDEEFISNYSRNPNDNAYLLYTRFVLNRRMVGGSSRFFNRPQKEEVRLENPMVSQVLEHGNINSVLNSNFNNNKVTVFLAHGWLGNGGNEMNRLLRDAFLENGDVNVIVLDWSRLANKNYVTAKEGTAAVGDGLGKFAMWLNTLGVDYQSIHFVGFSLGGHLVGSAGRTTSGRVARVTALDPAGPLWLWDCKRVRPSDAQYVEVIHTNAGFLGYKDPCGDADFYPNGGSSMPGCWTNTCSHSMVYKYMASSVRNNQLLANECDSLRDAITDRCNGSLYPMGNSDLNKTRHGIFRVNTGRNYPF